MCVMTQEKKIEWLLRICLPCDEKDIKTVTASVLYKDTAERPYANDIRSAYVYLIKTRRVIVPDQICPKKANKQIKQLHCANIKTILPAKSM